MRVAIVISVLAFSAALFAQTGSPNLRGRVTDSDGSPVRGAEVSISGLSTSKLQTVTSDQGGKFEFNSVPAGRYVISAVGEGDSSSGAAVVVVNTGSAVVADLVLGPRPMISEVVDVSVSGGTVQPVSEIAKTIDVISREQLDSRGHSQLSDSLRSLPGFRVQQLGGFGKTASVKSRGLRNQDTAVLLDGMRFRDPTAITGDASPFLSDLSGYSADRIEVLRGSGSSIYGTNAIGGVVDVRSLAPSRGLGGSFDADYAGLGTSSVRGDLTGGNDRLGFAVAAARTVVSKGIDGEDDAENNRFQARVDLGLSPVTTITGRIFVTDAFVRLNTNPDTIGPSATGSVDASIGNNFVADQNDPDNFQDSSYFAGRIGLSHSFGTDLFFEANYQRLNTFRENSNGPLGPGRQPFGGDQTSIFDGSIDTFNARMNLTIGPSSLLTAGVELEREEYLNEGRGPGVGSDFLAGSSQKSTSLYVQQLAGFLENSLQVSGGFRTQFFGVGSAVFSAANAPYEGLSIENPPAAYTLDGSAAYTFRSTGTKLRAHAGNGYRVPSLYERLGTFYSSFSQSFIALGDPDLEPERSIAFDAGLDQPFLGGKANLSVNYFYTKLTDVIGYGNVVPDIGDTSRPFGGYLNQEGGISRGFEAALTLRPDRETYVFTSYTYTNSDQREPQVSGSGVITTLGVPEKQFTAVISRRIAERLTLSFDLLVSDSYLAPIFSNQDFSTVIYRFGGNRRGNLSAVYRLPVWGDRMRLVFRGAVRNVFDEAYFENGFATEGRTARIGAGFEF